MLEKIGHVVGRIVLAIILIAVANIFLNNTIPFSVFNIGAVAIFSVPGLLIIMFLIYFVI